MSETPISQFNDTLTETEERRRGRLIAELLNLKHCRNFPDRYPTEHGSKTDLGLFRMMERIVKDGE